MKNKYRVRIIEDYKYNGEAKGMLGVYQGDFRYPGGNFSNPRILLDNGKTIWGIECWWEEYNPKKSMKESEKIVNDYINSYNKFLKFVEKKIKS